MLRPRHTHPDDSITSLDDWRRIFAAEGTVIVDEYDRPVTATEMLATITERAPWVCRGYESVADVHSIPGPQGLRRARVDGTHCIGHGEGTWDIHVGEFS